MIEGINRSLDILKDRTEELNDEYLRTDNIEERNKLDIKIKEIWILIDKLENEIKC